MNKKFIILTDWRKPHISWLVTVLEKIEIWLKDRGFDVKIISPLMFKTFSLMWYREIKIALVSWKKLKKILIREKPDYIHIVWDWPIWWRWVSVCNKLWLKYTTSFHTKLPEYLYLRTGYPISYSYNFLKKVHKNAYSLLVTTKTLKDELELKWFKNINVYPLGVDSSSFQRIENVDLWYKKPIFTFMWRVAIEKNIEDFLKLELPWTKLVIWNWPARKKLEKKYNDTKFVWYKKWKELTRFLSWSDLFIFPSKTDTFWLTILEAMSCWLPVIAYDVMWPKDIIINWYNWFIWNELQENIFKWLKIWKENPINTAKKFTWENTIDKFLEYQIINKKE